MTSFSYFHSHPWLVPLPALLVRKWSYYLSFSSCLIPQRDDGIFISSHLKCREKSNTETVEENESWVAASLLM